MSAQNCSLKVTTAFFTALSIFTALTGCGNKGPLYLPPEPVEEVTEAPTSSASIPTSEPNGSDTPEDNGATQDKSSDGENTTPSTEK